MTESIQSRYLLNLIDDPSLVEPERLLQRLKALDSLDSAFGDLTHSGLADSTISRLTMLRRRLEEANELLYRELRSEIIHDGSCHSLLLLMESLASDHHIHPGPAFDYRDDLISGVLQLHDPGSSPPTHGPEMVFYQPTPLRHIFDMIRLNKMSRSDVFVDLGSGLGHVALLTALFTGAECVGIEVEPAYVASARECAERLRISRVQFHSSDARAADLSRGTVFYLYTPFIGSILSEVIEKIRLASLTRDVTICTLGPCTSAVAEVPWLIPRQAPDPARITVFSPTLPKP